MREIMTQLIKPDYYKAPNNQNLQVMDVIKGWNLHCNFYLANAIKYILRFKATSKAKRIEDLQKAITYLTFEIEALREIKEVNND